MNEVSRYKSLSMRYLQKHSANPMILMVQKKGGVGGGIKHGLIP